MSGDIRFKGALVDDYDLIKNHRPKAENNYADLVQPIRKHFGNYRKGIIFSIDIGCGDGDATEYMLKADSRIKILALDPDIKMIDRLVVRFPTECRIGIITPLLSKIQEVNPKIFSDSIDLIVSAWTLHNFKREERHQVLEECYRMLSPGGLFINMDKYMPSDPAELEKISAYHKSLYDIHLSYGRPDIRESMLKHHAGDMSPGIIMKENESLEEMKQIGFKNVRLESKTRLKSHMVATK